MPITRRDLMKGAAVCGASLLIPGCATSVHYRSGTFPKLDAQPLPFLGLATSLPEEHDYEARIEGKIPAELRGTLFRNTTGLFDRNGLRKRTMFDGDGMVQSFRFHETGVHYRNRYVGTEKYRDESAAGTFLYPTFSTQAPGGWLANFWPGDRVKSQAQVTVMVRNGRLYAFDESSHPYELDPETLATVGVSYLGLSKDTALYGAHSKIDPVTGEWLLFGLHYGKNITLHITAFDRNGMLGSHRTITLPRYVYIHDFAATDRHLVFILHPFFIHIFGFLFGLNSMSDALRWQPDEGNLLLIVDRNGSEEPRYIETDPCFLWHTVNAWERDGEIMTDFIGYDHPDHLIGPDPPVYASMRGEKGAYEHPGRIRRYTITRRNAVRREVLAEGNYEWPSMHLHHRCRPYRFCYAAHAQGDDFFWSGISRIDTATGRTNHYFFGEGRFCGEPVFAPLPGFSCNPSSDDERGWLMTLVYDGNTRKSSLSVLRADRIEDGPVATIHLRHHSPYSMHGFWQGYPPS